VRKEVEYISKQQQQHIRNRNHCLAKTNSPISQPVASEQQHAAATARASGGCSSVVVAVVRCGGSGGGGASASAAIVVKVVCFIKVTSLSCDREM
jgi:hypothetical protein